MRVSFTEELSALEASLQEEGDLVLRALRSSLNALARGDQELADLDELIDHANRNAAEDVLSLGNSVEEREYGWRMLVVFRCVERIGDHAVDIGEQVVYLVTGEFREFSDASHPA